MCRCIWRGVYFSVTPQLGNSSRQEYAEQAFGKKIFWVPWFTIRRRTLEI